MNSGGEFHDQGDAKWIVIKGQLWGHNDMTFGQPTPADLSAAWGLAALGAYLVFLVTIKSVILFFNIVPLIMEFTWSIIQDCTILLHLCCVERMLHPA
jgi:hypothetical protein